MDGEGPPQSADPATGQAEHPSSEMRENERPVPPRLADSLSTSPFPSRAYTSTLATRHAEFTTSPGEQQRAPKGTHLACDPLLSVTFFVPLGLRFPSSTTSPGGVPRCLLSAPRLTQSANTGGSPKPQLLYEVLGQDGG